MLSIEGITVNMEGQKRRRIEIDEASGLIIKVSEPTGKADVVLKDELIFPGFVDLHVHARECADHSWDYKEDFVTAGEAAINGGVVAFADMPNNPMPPTDDESYEAKNNLAKKSGVEVLLYAGIGANTKPLSQKVPYKVFMGPSIGDLFFKSKKEFEEKIKSYSGQNVSFHCEDPEILEENKNKPTHEERRPKETEISAIDFALSMIEKYSLRGKICHGSTSEGLEKIIAAKKRGVNVTVEIAPHHLYFDQSVINKENQKWLQVNPPLRGGEDKAYLIEALRDGRIDFLATDHAPHTIQEKEKGMSGMPHLDTFGPFITWLVKEHNFTPQDIARVCSYNPGNFFNQFALNKPASALAPAGKYGKIEEGYAGSLTIIDMNKPITITKEKLKTKCNWSPFEEITFPGSVTMTVIKGKIYGKK